MIQTPGENPADSLSSPLSPYPTDGLVRRARGFFAFAYGERDQQLCSNHLVGSCFQQGELYFWLGVCAVSALRPILVIRE